MDNEKLITEYADSIRWIIPEFSEENAREILNGDGEMDLFSPKLGFFEWDVINGLASKYRALYRGYILNHTTFKLSSLDMEMIKHVPQGGNWMDIPIEIAQRSQRLVRIIQTGGRTTLYGRIDYDKPSYTITTYFNRPGNGTYVHPAHERVISTREAARFQTFTDDYYFFGTKNDQLKQVGNAVPTVLAYQIGKKIKEVTGCSKSIDLFCGAGGLTAGFKAAGMKSLLCTDIDEKACATIKINNPEIQVLCGDITSAKTKAAVSKVALEGGADIICGGPPCQGFSLAGFRAADDPRNQLFRDFVDIVKDVNPKVIVFENVEGLLSYGSGETYREVHRLFSKLGYETEGRTLLASKYAVPQRRKRVIIICTRTDLNISPSDLFPVEITPNPDQQVTARETIGDLEHVDCGEFARYSDDAPESDILRFLKKEISYEKYVIGRTSTVET